MASYKLQTTLLFICLLHLLDLAYKRVKLLSLSTYISVWSSKLKFPAQNSKKIHHLIIKDHNICNILMVARPLTCTRSWPPHRLSYYVYVLPGLWQWDVVQCVSPVLSLYCFDVSYHRIEEASILFSSQPFFFQH